MRLSRPLVALLMLAAAAGVVSDASAQATAGAAILQIPPGARAEGMGRIHASVADDAFTPWWNPAGLGFNKGFKAGLMHTKLVPDLADDVYFEYASVSGDVEGWGGLAGTISFLSYGKSVQTTETTIGDEFYSFEIAPSFAMGVEVIPNVALGVNLKLVYVNLASGIDLDGGGGSGASFGADLGALYRGTKDSEDIFGLGAGQWEWSVGVNAANLGPNISLGTETDSDPLPRNVKAAANIGTKVPKSFSFLLGAGIERGLLFQDKSEDAGEIEVRETFWTRNELQAFAGMELGFMEIAYGRLGYIHDDIGGIKDPTFGLGFRLSGIALDWASVPQHPELGRVNKISITYQNIF